MVVNAGKRYIDVSLIKIFAGNCLKKIICGAHLRKAYCWARVKKCNGVLRCLFTLVKFKFFKDCTDWALEGWQVNSFLF
ncbi:hypothetical protein BIY37_03115 [Candidatus Brocadia sapporoensis]|uniref:Uncharacterized protein n=1 Tax=Candidatus Brocadia sapporoensis TaxID=392547 RepID=A0A1V6M2B6_9BACT|nr:hypothetical protein BIY37_03115 [Candidatus Brocadia sapporoensis]